MTSNFDSKYQSPQIVACSHCFADFGFTNLLEQYGVLSSTPCPICHSTQGHQLSFSKLYEASCEYFVNGSVPIGHGIFAPILQINSSHGTYADTGISDLNDDLRKLCELHEIFCFRYGPPLWMFGKPASEEGVVEWEDADFDRIIDNCKMRHLDANERFYRAQLNLKDAEINPSRFCAPPEKFREKLWRFDSRDLNICYTALDIETCLHETRVTLQHEPFVAVLEATKTLKVLDMTVCEDPAATTPFEDPRIWLAALLYDGEHSYEVCRKLAMRIYERGFDGFIYHSYFQQAGSKPRLNFAIFGTPICSNSIKVVAITRVSLTSIDYKWRFAPVIKTNAEAINEPKVTAAWKSAFHRLISYFRDLKMFVR